MGPKTGDLSRQVYTQIREAILASELLPGHKLSHHALAQRLGVSSTPLREALTKLSQEGYVQHVQNRGYFVSDFSQREVEELLDIREALEGQALRAVLEGLTEKKLRALGSWQDAYRRAVSNGSEPERLLCDRGFHLTLAELSGNRTLNEMLAQVFDRINLMRRVEGLSPERGQSALAEHDALLAALKAGEPARARVALRRHLKKNKENFLQRMRHRTSFLRPVR
ncbi:MAG: GntR family transcriptional regulator [Nitrospinota bacterium]